MVNNSTDLRGLGAIPTLLRGYLVVVLLTVFALAVLSTVAPVLAPTEAWVHAVIVTIFAVVLLVRTRPAARGSLRALRAIGLICAVLLLANVIEALVPGVFPAWMRVEMVGIAVLMGVVVVLVALVAARQQHASRTNSAPAHPA